MNYDKEKTTAPNMSVGADKKQPIPNNIISSIPNNNGIVNELNENFDDSLSTITMSELYENVYRNRPPIIDGLLHVGTYLFVGAPKVGKSFFMAQLAYHVSTGTSIWGHEVRKGTVLYLALEDDYKRLQERLFRMYGTESTDNLYFSICAKQLDNGLDNQLQKFTQEHPDTKLIIIDTLQRIRESGNDKYSYSNDYEIIGKLKRFADDNCICLLLVHHTRKQQADDKFDMISGTNGLLGAADGALLLQKEKRTSNNAILDISGRDQQDQRFYLMRDEERLIWNLERAETEVWKEPVDPILEAISKFITPENSDWNGSPTELVNVLDIDMKPNVLSLRLNVRAGKLFNDYSIRYESSRTHAGRNIRLTFDVFGKA